MEESLNSRGSDKGKPFGAASCSVLVIEDESEIRELITLLLTRAGWSVATCSTALEALAKVEQSSFDLLVLDWMLPQLSGVEFLKLFRQNKKNSMTAVLMLTAKTSPDDLVTGLEAGADDYVTKPFEPNVFLARVKALLRRTELIYEDKKKPHQEHTLICGDISINKVTYEVKVLQEPIALTPSEFKILLQMAMNQGRVMTRDYLVQVVQGEGITVTGRTIDTHVFGLRKKLGAAADWIETIRGVGYRIKSS